MLVDGPLEEMKCHWGLTLCTGKDRVQEVEFGWSCSWACSCKEERGEIKRKRKSELNVER